MWFIRHGPQKYAINVKAKLSRDGSPKAYDVFKGQGSSNMPASTEKVKIF